MYQELEFYIEELKRGFEEIPFNRIFGKKGFPLVFGFGQIVFKTKKQPAYFATE